MPKRRASQAAISYATHIYEEFFPKLGRCYNRYGDESIVIDIDRHSEEGEKDYFRIYLRANLKVSHYPYRYPGGFELDLCFTFALPRYTSNPKDSCDYSSTGTAVIVRDIGPNWQRLEKSKAIASIASSCEGALRDGRLISDFFLNRFVPLQSAVLESLTGLENRTWSCRILGEKGTPWYHHQRPTKCLVHGEWSCRLYIQEWAKFHFRGREFIFKEMVTTCDNMRKIKPGDLCESIKETTPMFEVALAEIEQVINTEEFKRKKLMRIVKPLFSEKRERRIR